jgi:hypothetical protein
MVALAPLHLSWFQRMLPAFGWVGGNQSKNIDSGHHRE